VAGTFALREERPVRIAEVVKSMTRPRPGAFDEAPGCPFGSSFQAGRGHRPFARLLVEDEEPEGGRAVKYRVIEVSANGARTGLVKSSTFSV